VAGFKRLGTSIFVAGQSKVGGLPTRNWSSGTFEGADGISGERMAETIFQKADTCYGCAVRCKRVVGLDEGPYKVDPRYGGPEYESLSALGSYCGVSDLAAVAYANQLCNMYGIDTIAAGGSIAWAMDCFEQELISVEDTGGIELRFGNAEALVELIEQIGERKGFGRVLGLGSARAAQELGVGEDLVVAIKGRELPAHMPQVKRAMALLYAVNPGGADHTIYEHDPAYAGNYPDTMAELGLLDPQPSNLLNAEKVRYAVYSQRLISIIDALCVCKFVYGPAWQLFSTSQLVETVQAITGWSVSLWELMKMGERRINLLRAFNAREGSGIESDTLPIKIQTALEGGATDGVAVTQEEFETARALYYQMNGWDEKGMPTQAKLYELGLGWVADQLYPPA
jgi:aldehyde:ferredoxin oxidoreductase